MRRPIIMPGDLDREITFLAPVTSKDAGGRPKTTWEPFDDPVFAQVFDNLPSRGERVTQGGSVAIRRCRVRAWYRSDITPQMRIRLDGVDLRIDGKPAELGRREGIEFMAEELTTMGQEP